MTAVLRTNGLLLAGASLSTAITPELRARVLNDSLVGFLWLLVLLLALSLMTIIRIKPPERAAAAEEPAQGPVPIFRPPGLPAPESMQRRVAPAPLPMRSAARPGVTQPPLSQRPVGQRPVGQRPVGHRPAGQQPGYAARHAPRDVPGQDAVPGQGAAQGQGAAARPRVSGGPPWGPAPKPSDQDPFARSSDWPSSDWRSSDR
jgi:hypothetical protein